jgi:predicted enzyme related to lactoylglutathione lyase
MAHRHHALDYIELAVDDVAAAKKFYAEAFGWSFTDYGPDYAAIQDPDSPADELGGLIAETLSARGQGALVLLYSSDLGASREAVVAAGGTITTEPYGFPGGRRFHFDDPSGNGLGVWAEASG